jgi:hypothetical protein
MNYEVEQKRHWRYWVWKRIADNCGVHPSFATVLFLSGPSPSDLQAAKKYGFKLRNIVAVDMNAECVEAARKAGCTAIQGSLHEVVTKWNDGQIHGVVADYCFGLTLHNIIDSYQIASRVNACAFNFQRGRECDEESRKLRDYFNCKNRAELMRIMLLVISRAVVFMSDRHGIASEKHDRFWDDVISPDKQYSLAAKHRHLLLELRRLTFSACFWQMAAEYWIEADEVKEFIADHPAFSQMQICSYRSNKVVMDSLVGAMGRKVAAKSDIAEFRVKALVDRRLAATKAIRTMNGAVRFASPSN